MQGPAIPVPERHTQAHSVQNRRCRISSLSRIFHCLMGVLCLGLVIASPITAGAGTTCTESATHGVGPLLANATDLGSLAPDTTVHLVVALALQDQGGSQKLIQEENTPGKALLWNLHHARSVCNHLRTDTRAGVSGDRLPDQCRHAQHRSGN